jgi:hypothetical protein
VSELSGSRNPNWTILGVEREFPPIERLEYTAKGIWSSFEGEKHALDCLISIAKQNFSVCCHLRRLRDDLKIVFQLELLSERGSPQLREPDNLRTFVSSPLVAGAVRLLDFELEQFSPSSQMKLSNQWA